MISYGCDDGVVADPPLPPPSVSEPEPPEVEAAGPRSLSDTLDAFTDVESCVVRLERGMPIDVEEGLRDLGQDRLAAHICEGLHAVKVGDEAACDALVLSASRRACRTRLAIRHRRPEACPTDRVLEGREPGCLAWASGLPLLCQALAPDPAATCRAVLSTEPESCAEVPESERDRCAFFRRRYPSVSGQGEGQTATMPTLFEVAWTRTQLGEPDEEGRERFAFGRWGVSVERRAEGDFLVVSDPTLAPEQVGLRAGDNRWFQFEARLPADTELPERRQCPADCVVDFRGRPDVALRTEGLATGHVDWAEFAPERGARVLVHFRLNQVEGARRTEVRGRVRAFVRDVVDLREEGSPAAN